MFSGVNGYRSKSFLQQAFPGSSQAVHSKPLESRAPSKHAVVAPVSSTPSASVVAAARTEPAASTTPRKAAHAASSESASTGKWQPTAHATKTVVPALSTLSGVEEAPLLHASAPVASAPEHVVTAETHTFLLPEPMSTHDQQVVGFVEVETATASFPLNPAEPIAEAYASAVPPQAPLEVPAPDTAAHQHTSTTTFDAVPPPVRVAEPSPWVRLIAPDGSEYWWEPGKVPLGL